MEDASDMTAAAAVAEAVSPGPMNGLPDEVLRHVLSFLHIDSILSAMRVNRKWEKAARYEVKHRKSLIISKMSRCAVCEETDVACQSCKKKRFSDNGVIHIDVNGDYAVLFFLMKMQRLQKLDAYRIPEDRIAFLIMQNAKTVRVLRGVFKLPAAPSLVYGKLVELECIEFDQETATACPNISVLRMEDGSHSNRTSNSSVTSVLFPNLVELDITGTSRDAADFNQFIALHAHQLKTFISKGPHPLEVNGRPVVYENLEELRIIVSDSYAVTNCSKLQRLEITSLDDQTDLSHLPVQSMRSLSIIDPDEDDFTVKGLTHIVETVSRLVHLTDFKLTAFNIPLEQMELKCLTPLFSNSRRLENVTIGLDGCYRMDLMVDTVVRRNPRLQKLYLDGIRVSDPVIVSMSRLSHLRSLTLTGNHVTTENLIKLTTGASGGSLTKLRVKNTVGFAMDRVEEAFVLMLTKRGLTPDRSEWTKNNETGDFCLSC